jgi:hypothetical protein
MTIMEGREQLKKRSLLHDLTNLVKVTRRRWVERAA